MEDALLSISLERTGADSGCANRRCDILACTYEHVDLCRSVRSPDNGNPRKRAGRDGNDIAENARDGDPGIPPGIDPRSAAPFGPDHSPGNAAFSRCLGNSERTLLTRGHLVITGTVAPASICLVLSPIIPGRKPPKSHSNTHRGPARNTRPARAPMSEKRRARSFDLSAPRTPLEPALRHGVSPLHRQPTHRTSATDSS